MNTKYFVGDKDKVITIPIGFDIQANSNSVLRIKYKKPNNETGYWEAEIGADGESIQYTLSAVDLDMPGLWQLQSYINTGLHTGRDINQSILVYPQIESVYVPIEDNPADVEVEFTTKTFTCNGTSRTFQLDYSVKENSLSLFLNGVLLVAGVDYALSGAGNVFITTNQTYDLGWKLHAYYAKG